MLADLLFAAASLLLAYHTRIEIIANLYPGKLRGVGPLQDYIWFLYIYLPLIHIVFRARNEYSPHRLHLVSDILWRVFSSVAIVTLLFGTVIFFAKDIYFSRPILVLTSLYLFVLSSIGRIFVIAVLYLIRGRGFNTRSVLLIGTGGAAFNVLRELASHRFWGYRVVGLVSPTPELAGRNVLGQRVLGTLDALDQVIREHVVDDVFIVGAELPAGAEEVLLRLFESVGIVVHLVPDTYDLRIARASVGEVAGEPLITFSPVPSDSLQLAVKRAFDVAASILALVTFPLVYAVVGLVIKLESRGPILYRQTRVGRNRRKFTIYKFRTMVDGADQMLHLLENVNECTGPIRKSRADSRVTRVGRWLRRWSIDEVPQFINILKGDMSLVGPRPPTPDEVDRYSLEQLRKLSMPQGLTGLWQVSGRDGITDFDQRLRLDLFYIDNWSLGMDLAIIARTFRAVAGGAK